MTHSLRPVRAAATPAWPTFNGTAQRVGTTPSGRVTVYVDAALGAQGLQNAKDLLGQADSVVTQNDAIFGTPGGRVDVIVYALSGATDGTGGADHASCNYVTGNALEVDATFSGANSAARAAALFEAELSECSMGGNLCGVSTGEALSRWCAATTSNNALSDFATAPQWFQDGTPDFVTRTDPTDQSADSTGCGMAFISWLMHKNGKTLNQIAQGLVALGAGGTFAQLYTQLTGDQASPWPAFIADIQALPNGVTNDDPFGGLQVKGAAVRGPSPERDSPLL
jgi:hypothetical protein